MYKISVQSKLRTLHFLRFHSLWVSISSHSILFAKGRLVSRLLCGFKVTRHLLDIYSQESEYFYIKKRWKSWDEKCHFFRKAHKTIFYQKYTLKKIYKTLWVDLFFFVHLPKKAILSASIYYLICDQSWLSQSWQKCAKKKNLSRFLELQLSY